MQGAGGFRGSRTNYPFSFGTKKFLYSLYSQTRLSIYTALEKLYVGSVRLETIYEHCATRFQTKPQRPTPWEQMRRQNKENISYIEFRKQ